MDWARAVEINRIALTRIVAELFAMLGLVSSGTVERLLRPAESALRRLIVIAARGLVVKPALKRAMPKGLVIVRTGSNRMSFRLFDKRQKFDFVSSENPVFVKVQTYQNNPFNLFNPPLRSQPAEQNGSMSAVHQSRRLAALAQALETLPRQAWRLARWKLRRKSLVSPKFTSPLRPGPPPGHRKKPKLKIDFVLQECHALAHDALKVDSS
jgi:hypothetical protein